jgi:hypothetical protein
MAAPLPSWSSHAADAIRQLADRPWTLFLLLLAVNTIARPCSITAHDARLYSLQALNQAEHGAYGDDVFLRFGSQDQFSLFSRTVGPLVEVMGLRLTFFVLYVVFNTLFVFALFRLARALIDDGLIATLALVYLVAAPLNYGGGDIFTVHEQFFTPRVVGTTFTLFALERLLRGRYLAAAGLLLVGLLMHPLMAFGGVLIWAGFVCCTLLSSRVFAWLVIGSVFALVMLLLAETLTAVSLFGLMGADWHHSIRMAVGYNYPDTWRLKDWLNIAVSLALPAIACVELYRDDPVRRRFCLIVTLAGIAGLAVHMAASYLPYALLFQGQPYRVLWILKVVQVPLGFALIARWSEAPALAAKLAALALVAFFCVIHYIAQELKIFALAIPASLLWSRFGSPSAAGWWHGTARGFVLGAIGWMAYRWQFFIDQRDLIAQHFDLNELVLFDLVSPIFLIAGVVAAATCWLRSPASFSALRWSAAAIALATPLALFATETSPAFQRDHTRHGRDMAFVRAFIQERDAGQSRHPSVYCPLNRADLLWIDAKATSYFSILQTAGVMFNRQTAQEIDRRIALVNTFEMAQQRRDEVFPDEAKRLGMANLFKLDFNCPEPTQDDLVRLCQEPGLDYVVIPQEFPGLYSASNGRLFVYECYKIGRLRRSTDGEHVVVTPKAAGKPLDTRNSP